MAPRDKSTLSQRRGKSSSTAAADDKDNNNNKTAAAKPRHKMTEEELDDEFEAKCEKWCGVGLRVIFAAYSLFGVATSTYEWATRPSMAGSFPPHHAPRTHHHHKPP